jgi:hypothetical protein
LGLDKPLAELPADFDQQLKAIQRNPAYREFDGVGHDCWTPAYRFGADGALDWMFGKRRQDGSIAVRQPPVPVPSAPNAP